MTKLFFCEKPSQAKMIAKSVAKEGDVFVITPVVVSYKFKYPSNLSYKEYPYNKKNPTYKINHYSKMFDFDLMISDSNGELSTNTHIINNSIKKLFNYLISLNKSFYKNEILTLRNEIKEYFKTFEEWVVANDADHSGARAFDFYIEHFLNEYRFTVDNNSVTRLFAYAYDDKSLKKAFLNRESYKDSPNVKRHQDVYKNRDFFNYNFNINSLLIFDNTFKEIGCFNQNFIMTYNMLQTMLLLRDVNLTESNLIRELELRDIGSCVSRSEIIRILFEQYLIEKTERFRKEKVLQLSAEGIEFIELIHNKINSLNPVDVSKDFEEMNHKEFKEKYSNKLETFFKKQRNFLKLTVEAFHE